MTAIWFLIIFTFGSGGAIHSVPFQDEKACRNALERTREAQGTRISSAAICVPDRTLN